MSSENPIDRETLAAVFASRVSLVKKTEDQAAEEARVEHRRALAWVKSGATKEGSFLWMCDEFDLDPAAVRRAVKVREAKP